MSAEYPIDGSSWKSALSLPRWMVGAQAGLPLMGAVSVAVVSSAESVQSVGLQSVAYAIGALAMLSGFVAPIVHRRYSRPPLESPSIARPGDSYRGSGGRVLTDPVHARVTFVNAERGPLNARIMSSFLPLLLGLVAMGYGLPGPVVAGLGVMSTVLVLSAYPRESEWKAAAEERFGAVFDEEYAVEPESAEDPGPPG